MCSMGRNSSRSCRSVRAVTVGLNSTDSGVKIYDLTRVDSLDGERLRQLSQRPRCCAIDASSGSAGLGDLHTHRLWRHSIGAPKHGQPRLSMSNETRRSEFRVRRRRSADMRRCGTSDPRWPSWRKLRRSGLCTHLGLHRGDSQIFD